MSGTLQPPPPRDTPISTGGSSVFSQPWSGWFRQIFDTLGGGLTGTVALAKLTVGGTNGSLTVKNGVIKSYTPPT